MDFPAWLVTRTVAGDGPYNGDRGPASSGPSGKTISGIAFYDAFETDLTGMLAQD